jgi:hypothetical protein
MDEPLAGRLERTGQRARALFGSRPTSAASAESSETATGPPSDVDAALLAERIHQNAGVGADAALAMAVEIVAQAQVALAKLDGSATDATLDDTDALALESVIHVRSRPALRVYEHALEALANYPGCELWQDFIADYEDGILRAAAATGAVTVNMFGSGNPPWVQGSAWLIAPDRVLTNRHVVLSDTLQLVNANTLQLNPGVAIAIEFAANDRRPAASICREVTKVLYVAPPADPVDIAVLGIKPRNDLAPFKLMADGVSAPRNLFVVGHPAPMTLAPAAVQAVFRNLDGSKRVSFGKLLDRLPAGDILHDASTVGGYSGAPVVGISSRAVAGLHYYGDPTNGNLAIAAETIRAHDAHQYCQ